MNIFTFTLLSLRGRKINVFFTIIAIMFAVALILTTILVSKGVENGIKDQAGSYDLIVGAEGSPIQLVLNSLVYIDAPIGNIPYHIYEDLLTDERLLKVVPIALGDSFYGSPIIGTNQDFFTPFREGLKARFSLQTGKWFTKSGEVVLGSETAKNGGLKIGDTFHGNHGVADNALAHQEFEYKVVGILSPTGSANDRAIFTLIESVWEVHEHAEMDGNHENEKQVTALLIKPEQLGFVPQLKEQLEENAEVQAVYPVKIFRDVLNVFNTSKAIAKGLVGISILLASLFVIFAVLNAMSQREKETHILRALGVTRNKLMVNILFESIFICGIGTLLGVMLTFVFIFVANNYSQELLGIPLNIHTSDLSGLIYGLYLFGIAVLLSLLPTLTLYKGAARTEGRM